MQKFRALCLLIWFFFACFCLITSASSIAQRVRICGQRYTIDFDTILMIPQRVEWEVSPSDLGRIRRDPDWRFTQDPRVSCPQPTHDDYTRSGFDRGHMMPAADRSADRSLMRQTFYITNVCPQTPRLNRGAWKKIEDATRKYVTGGHPLRVIVTPVFWQADTQRIGRSRVAVPHGFIKTIRTVFTDSIIYSRYFDNN